MKIILSYSLYLKIYYLSIQVYLTNIIYDLGVLGIR